MTREQLILDTRELKNVYLKKQDFDRAEVLRGIERMLERLDDDIEPLFHITRQIYEKLKN